LLHQRRGYYPFGLTIAGISAKAVAYGERDNNTKYQNQEFTSNEFSDGTGMNMYEFKWRMHDQQIGSCWQIDPLSDKYLYNFTYPFSENKVTAHVELGGLESVGVFPTTQDVYRSAVITILVASAGTAAPLFVGLSGAAGVSWGIKLGFNIAGNYDEAAKIPTTLSGIIMFTMNSIPESANGNTLFSEDVQVLAEFAEGMFSLNRKGWDKMADIDKVNAALSGVTLTLDILDDDVLTALKNLMEGQQKSVGIPPSHNDNLRNRIMEPLGLQN
jgi:hypothetical protein